MARQAHNLRVGRFESCLRNQIRAMARKAERGDPSRVSSVGHQNGDTVIFCKAVARDSRSALWG